MAKWISPGTGSIPGFWLVLLVFCLRPDLAAAQDSHYWDNQYGTKAELLGGVVVGSSTDLSATFYNPGWIAMQDSPSVLLTTKAAEVYSIKLDSGPDQMLEPSSTTITPSPGYFAGRFSLGDDWGWKWAYSYLQKMKFEYNSKGIIVDEEVVPPPQGHLWTSGEAFREVRASESWYGFSISRKLNENLALGFSPYAAYRTQNSRSQLTSQVLAEDLDYWNSLLVEDFHYYHIRLLMKIGVAYQADGWSLGAAVTTPSLGIMGDGDVYVNASFAGNYDPNSPGNDPPYLQANHQKELEATWKSPLSIAGGGSISLNKTRFHFTAEWFNKVSRYQVLDPVPYEIQARPGQTDQVLLEYAAKSLINVGVGVDHMFSDNFSLYSSYRLDQSTTPEDLDSNLSTTVWDLNHISCGASFHFMSMEFTTGLQFSWGNGNANRFTQFDLDEDNGLVGRFEDHQVNYRRLKALLGFNLPFGTQPELDFN